MKNGATTSKIWVIASPISPILYDFGKWTSLNSIGHETFPLIPKPFHSVCLNSTPAVSIGTIQLSIPSPDSEEDSNK